MSVNPSTFTTEASLDVSTSTAMNLGHGRHAATVDPCPDDPYASVWRLCKTPSFRLPRSPPQALSSCRRVEYCQFGPIPLHLLSNYLCFAPLPPNKRTNRQQGSSSSQSPLNTAQDSRLPHKDLCLHQKDGTTTRPCSNLCYEDDSPPDQVHESCENQYTHTPIICVTNSQDSLPLVLPEGEMSLRAGDVYDQSSILLLEELKELCLWDQDCVMDEDDVNFMVSVMCKFRKLAFVRQVKVNHSYELVSKSRKLKKLSDEKSGKYFSPSMSVDANAAAVELIDLDGYSSSKKKKKKKKSNEKRKESQVECEADLGSGSSKLANSEIIDVTEDKPFTEPRSNAHHEAIWLGNKSSKRLGSFSVCYSRSIPKGRARSLADLVEVLCKKPKHSIDAD